jgi:hypothetical protein
MSLSDGYLSTNLIVSLFCGDGDGEMDGVCGGVYRDGDGGCSTTIQGLWD